MSEAGAQTVVWNVLNWNVLNEVYLYYEAQQFSSQYVSKSSTYK